MRLTLDIELQKDIQNALQHSDPSLLLGQDGQVHPVALVILNAADSKILAMISLPTFDLNTYDQHVTELLHDQINTPLLNRVVQAGYPPGSTVKGLVATAALTEKVVTPEETIVCTGHLFPNILDAYRCDAVHGPVQLVTAIEVSCNIYFYNMGMRLGYDRLGEWYRYFGFGAVTGTGLAEEFAGHAPTPARSASRCGQTHGDFIGNRAGADPGDATPVGQRLRHVAARGGEPHVATAG